MVFTFGAMSLRAVPGAAAWQGGHHCDDPYLWCYAAESSASARY